jgi:hypothetical protein
MHQWIQKSLELNKLFIKNTKVLMNSNHWCIEFDKYEVDVELFVQMFSKWICKHCGATNYDSQTFNQQCLI